MNRHERRRREAVRSIDPAGGTYLARGQTNAERIFDALETMRNQGRCQLCEGPPDHVGLFFPTPSLQRRLLAPPGKNRYVLFALCNACRVQPDVIERVDAKIVECADSLALRKDLN